MPDTDLYKLGQEFSRDGETWLVVRVVGSDQALVVDEKGNEMIIDETHVQIKFEKGRIDFVVISHKEIPYAPDPARKVSANPNLWRKANVG